MNRNLYNILKHVPIAGTIVKMKCDYFYMLCSPARADLYETGMYNVLKAWTKSHPDQILSPKKAAELMANARKQ